ncbi:MULTISPECIES: hypothetical protein [unclassified Rhizobium]|jgi:hypothetical protein|uniref:hypothetical protein n=1 Tax=unclassified Rhizobium TaxID=2613769 RepID=UPI0011C3FF8F|nr:MULTISPECIES: hypothetical protein [unclassified Rhizobium]
MRAGVRLPICIGGLPLTSVLIAPQALARPIDDKARPVLENADQLVVNTFDDLPLDNPAGITGAAA